VLLLLLLLAAAMLLLLLLGRVRDPRVWCSQLAEPAAGGQQ
jgi:hypothetical protein